MLTDELIKISLSKLERLFLVRHKKFVLTDRIDDQNEEDDDEYSSSNLAEFEFEYDD